MGTSLKHREANCCYALLKHGTPFFLRSPLAKLVRPFIKSITWRLQFWHAAILLFVVVGLSTAWFLQTRRARLSEIDADLLSAARVLDGSLRGFRLPRFALDADQKVQMSLSADRRLTLPRWPGVSASEISTPYFAIWLSGGQLLKSEGLPSDFPVEFDKTFHGGPVTLQREHYRDVRIIGPAGTQVLVGRDIHLELAAIRRLAVQIIAFSIAILLIGLIGGWWLSRSVLRPIHAMSAAAKQFSAKDMSPRIDTIETDTELGELAQLLNEAFDRVQSSFEQQQQFAADASHELRTPLAVIQSQIELALKRERAPGEYVKALSTCGEAGDRLSELVESLLTLARLDSSEPPKEYSELRLDRLVAKCTDLIRPVAEHAQVSLEVEHHQVSVLGNSHQLERAILNLLKNSIAYNRPGGSVHLSVHASNKQAELTISDTGVGIGEQHITHVAERFYRVDKARSRQQGGSGLGLSIAKQIIEAHRGTLQILSVLDQGTDVTVLLPQSEAGKVAT